AESGSDRAESGSDRAEDDSDRAESAGDRAESGSDRAESGSDRAEDDGDRAESDGDRAESHSPPCLFDRFEPVDATALALDAPPYGYDRKLSSTWLDLPAAPIPPGYFMFICDHRNGSSDGRLRGLMPRASITGRSEYVMFPLSRIKKTR
ncbi:MAG: hypothetical protein WD716_12305, partial [Fimbriimonadaceae bacterium]